MNTLRWAALVVVLCCSFAASCRRTSPVREFQLRKIVADAQAGGDSAISPDGTRFLTSLRRSGNWDVWMYDLRTRQWTQLTTSSADEFEARWSPDAGTIVYTSTERGNKDIFTMRLDERKPRPLTNDAEDDEYPVFAPDGTSIVFTGGPWMARRYFLVDSDGKNRRAVSDPSQAGACSFHPSGDSLVCHNYDSGTGNVYLYPIAGGDRLRLTQGGFWDYKPAASPNGQWVAFSRSQEASSAIWVMPFPAGKAFPLTGDNGDDRWPTWSADGNTLLFHRLVDKGAGIQTYNRQTGKMTPLVGGDENPGAASFDPTGQKIVYSTRRGQQESLRIRDLTTGKITNLETPGDASFPRWSPDGKSIAFALRRDVYWDLATLDLQTGHTHAWTNGESRGIRDVLNWSPDSRRIVYHASTQPFEADLYVLDTQSGSNRNVTRDHNFSQSPAFTKDGSGVTFMSTRGGNWTWGFFLLNLANNNYRLLQGPDYTEKNYPSLSASEDLLWSEFDTDGREYLAIKASNGSKRLLKEAGSWARWPSFSPDGSHVLYTAIDHTVEYWVAEGLQSASSPLHTRISPIMAPTRQSQNNAPAQEEGPNRSSRRNSPVQLHHR